MGHVSPGNVKSYSNYKQPATETTNKYQSKNNAEFLANCSANKAEPTSKQYSKWVRGRGKARNVSKNGRPIDEYGTGK